jgi:ABC-type multidrug transport system fused ATPase/permease subunit
VVLRRGDVVGVLGPSGSGKSTLAQILLRMRPPSEGEVLVNGSPAASYTKDSFYRHFTFVPQSCQLLHATVLDNIRLFDERVTRDQVIDAATRAGVHDTITALDHGYDTQLGPTTRDLSGGQIQRIGIARAVARGAEVIVLDEPTSALDVHSEATVQDTLADLRNDALVIIIAHRLSTLTICDRVLVMDQGRLAAEGSFEELLLDNEFFQSAMAAGHLELKS